MNLTTDKFVNPYTFIPLPPGAVGQRLAGPPHDGRHTETMYSGTIDVRWELKTPLLIPQTAKDEGWWKGRRVRIPGSSIAGSVRSLHEALFNGCYRIVDDAFTPGYREPARTNELLTLAVVSKAEDGVPRELVLCKDPVWIDCRDLLQCWPPKEALPTSGDVVRVAADREDIDGLARAEFVNVQRVDILRRAPKAGAPTDEDATVGARVLLVSSTSARKRSKKNNQPARAFWATGEITGTRVALDPKSDHDAAVLARFRAAAADTDDRRRLEGEPQQDEWRSRTTYESVRWPLAGKASKNVGRRAVATGQLFVGDAVWVVTDDVQNPTTVEEIKLAYVWRRAGGGTVGDRMPPHLRPCVPSPDGGLCLSCAVFGAADTTGDTQHQQVSYAGHVRFGAASGTITGNVKEVALAPLGVPRPGNGMFYLESYKPDRDLWQRNDGDPIPTHWGSPEAGTTKRIAGRKFYWHCDPAEQARQLGEALGRPVPPRYEATAKQRNTRMSRRVHLVPAGTVLTSRISVDQLDAVGVHTLLAALDPSRVLGALPGCANRRFASHLGGGKPLGLGSVVTTISAICLQPLGTRYTDARPAEDEWTAAPFPYPEVFQRVGRFTKRLPSLAKVLDLDALEACSALVSYPPGNGWETYASPREQEADEFTHSYKFFAAANGEHLAKKDRPWHSLPKPLDSPTLPIIGRH